MKWKAKIAERKEAAQTPTWGMRLKSQSQADNTNNKKAYEEAIKRIAVENKQSTKISNQS